MYFLNRLIMLVPLLLVISFLAFGLVHLAPGGPFDRERKPASPEIERAIKARFHLDEPFLKQYARYLGLIWEEGKDGRWRVTLYRSRQICLGCSPVAMFAAGRSSAAQLPSAKAPCQLLWSISASLRLAESF